MPPPTRVYIGRLSMRTTARDIDDLFSRFGSIVKLDMKNGFGFVEFQDERDAEDAIREMDGRDVDGNRIQVEHAKGPRPGGPPRAGGARSEFRVRVENISRETSWQDLKDFARGGGRLTPLFTEVTGGIGVIEYRSYEDMKDALRQLHDTELRGAYVKLYEDRGRSNPRSPPRAPPRDSYRSRSRSPYGRGGGGGGYGRSPPRRRPEDYSPPRYSGGGGGYRSRSR